MEKEILSKRIGQRLRLYRQQRNLSLEELAGLTGVSKPMLGQIERGISNPTVATLWKIASGLRVPFTNFISENPSLQLQRANEQHVFYEDNERFEVYSTFAEQGVPLEMFRVRMHPGCCRVSDPHGRGVIESITVYEGSLFITIGDESFCMNKGDAISFSADVHHVYENRQESPAEIAMSIYYQT
jgi:XRE family transcriptional regulator, regulator of sulfur utilization